MNFKSRRFKIEPCYVCGYLFSDRHHMYPGSKLTPKLNKATIPLCPNHHRYANIVQAMLEDLQSTETIQSFADQYFDAQFNEKALMLLIERYAGIEQRIQEYAMSIFEVFFGGKDAG